MKGKAEGLKAFYTGPVWKAHLEAANATMINSDNVLLLRQIKVFLKMRRVQFSVSAIQVLSQTW